MKNIILYGVRSKRFLFESNLDENYQIIGYTDGDDLYKDLNEYDYKPFYKIEQLKELNFDFLVILVEKKDTINKIYQTLLGFNIDEEKIIRWNLFNECDFRNPIREYENNNKKFSGYVFGMSHAYRSFLTHWFHISLFKFASASSDLFLINKYIEYLANLNTLDNNENKCFIFEFPYYIFNYDLSKFTEYMFARMNYFEIFDDYHNFNNQRVIEEFKEISKMKGKREYIVSSNNFETYNNNNALLSNDKQEIITIKPNVWYNIYQDTIKENILIWEKIVNTIKKRYPNSTIHVIVFPNNPIFIENHMEAILKMKNIFYENIFLENVEIILKDCFNMSYKHEDFEDYCHLQGKKSIEFSQYLSIYFKELLFPTSFC